MSWALNTNIKMRAGMHARITHFELKVNIYFYSRLTCLTNVHCDWVVGLCTAQAKYVLVGRIDTVWSHRYWLVA